MKRSIVVASLASFVVCCSATARAQTTTASVVPAAHETKEANGAAFWLASPFEARRQLIIDRRHLAAFSGKELVALAVRRNTGVNDTFPGGKLWIELSVSNTVATSLRPSPVFAANRGSDHRSVLTRYVSFQTSEASPTVPASWGAPHGVRIDFPKGFQYSGGSLLIETVTRRRRPSERNPTTSPWWLIDAQVDDPAGRTTEIGSSCIPSMPGLPAGVDPSSLHVGGTAVAFLHGGFRQGFVLLLLGAQEQSIDLTAVGAPGCHVYNDWLVAFPGRLLPLLGRHAQTSISLPLPADRSLVGTSFFTQWMVADRGANRLGVTLSNGVKATLGASPDLGVVLIESTKTDAPAGRILFGRAPVLQLHFKME